MKLKFVAVGITVLGLSTAVYWGCGTGTSSSAIDSKQLYLIEGTPGLHTVADLFVMSDRGQITDSTILIDASSLPERYQVYADSAPTPDPTPPPPPPQPPVGGPDEGANLGIMKTTWGALKARYR